MNDALRHQGFSLIGQIPVHDEKSSFFNDSIENKK
jgi:hypothetical protein